MKKFNYVCLLLILFVVSAGSIYSQTIDKSITLYPNQTIVTQKNGSNYEYGTWGIGSDTLSSDTYIDRSYYVFDLSSIEDNATITGVQVDYYMSGISFTFKLTKIASLSGDLQANWNAVGNGSSLHTGITYGSSYFNSDPIKTEISNALVSDQLIIGALSEAEETIGSRTTLTVDLDVEYTIPPQLINLTARNDLYGSDGGNIGVAIYPNSAVSHSSPYEFTAYETNRLILAAYDNQSVNDKVWFFNNTEYPDERSEWKKEKYGVFTPLGNSQSFTTGELTVSDDNATFIAYLKTTSYTTSGTMPSHEIWFTSPVTLTGNVTVPPGVTLEIKSGVSVSLNGNNIISTNGTITIESGATINPSNSHTRLITGSAIKGIYSTIASAMSAATSGQSIEVYGSHTLAANLTVPSGVTLTFKNGSDITLDSHTIQKGSGALVVESGATFTPDIRLMSGLTVLGLYTSLDAAYGDGSDVEIRGTHTFADYYTVTSGRILRAESGSELRFPPGKYLNVYGTLHGNQADFTSTSGTWGGIRYRSAGSGTLDHCTINHATYGIRSTSTSLHFTHNTISGCSYGIYCSSSSPEIRDNAVSNCSSYGVYLYNSSAELESNRISGSKVYLNNSDASLENNLITGAYGNEAVYFYASSPELYYNTISTENAFWALHATNGSDPVFGGPYTGNGTNYGYNALSTGFESDGVICASNGSVPWLGYGGYGAGYYGYGGNAILGGGLYPAAAMDATSCIFADWCWWGQTPAPPCYGDVTTYDPLSSDPGTGSTLSKSSPEPIIASHPEEEPGDKAAKALWEVAMGAVWEENYAGALDDFQTLIRIYPASNYAYRALSMSVRLCREQKTRDMLTYLDELLTGVDDKTLRAVIKSRKVSEYRRMKDTKQAIALSREILAENPETIHETTALFDLFNLYQKDLSDSVQADYYLTELKTRYPEDELTGMARIDWGEDPEKVVIGKRTLPGQEEGVLPEVFTLGSAYPNPFNPVTRLTYSLPDAGDLVFEVVDITGRIVDRIAFSNHPAGEHHFDYTASHLSTGLYIVRARYNRQVQIRKIVYMK